MEARPILGLPPLPLDNSTWREWEGEVLVHRVRVKQETEEPWSGQQRAREVEVARVKRDGRYWLSTYGSIYQARPDEDDMPVDLAEAWDSGSVANSFMVPFIPYVY